MADINISFIHQWGKFVARSFYIALLMLLFINALLITTINAKPIGPEFSKIHTQLSKIR